MDSFESNIHLSDEQLEVLLANFSVNAGEMELGEDGLLPLPECLTRDTRDMPKVAGPAPSTYESSEATNLDNAPAMDVAKVDFSLWSTAPLTESQSSIQNDSFESTSVSDLQTDSNLEDDTVDTPLDNIVASIEADDIAAYYAVFASIEDVMPSEEQEATRQFVGKIIRKDNPRKELQEWLRSRKRNSKRRCTEKWGRREFLKMDGRFDVLKMQFDAQKSL